MKTKSKYLEALKKVMRKT